MIWAVAFGIVLVLFAWYLWYSQKKMRRLEALAYLDVLTGIANRAAFERDIHRQSAVLDRLPEQAVVMVDINHFKRINDSYGHRFGDDVLAACARLLEDIFRHNGFCYRIGGDEFAVLLCCPQPERLMETFEGQLEQYRNDHQVFFELSYGISVYDPELDDNLYDTFSRADRQMYRNKHSKKAPVSFL